MIIGLAGKAGSGKSSVANYLCKRYDATKIAFADPLKKMAQAIWDFSDEQVYGPASVKETIDPRWGITPRWALQKLGTEACRVHLGADVWIQALLRRVNDYAKWEQKERLWVVEDVRFENEVRALQLQNFGTNSEGRTIPVERCAAVWRIHCSDAQSVADATHPSEAELDRISDEMFSAHLRSSRRQGLEHLFGLVDEEMKRCR